MVLSFISTAARVLQRALDYVQELASRNIPINFPFPSKDITVWLEQAKEDCLAAHDLQEAVGGKN